MLSRVRERFPGTEIERYASFIGESLKKTKTREFVPSQEEIAALLLRQEMSTTVYCHGGGSCKISINSHTTAGEVNTQQRQRHRQRQSLAKLSLTYTGYKRYIEIDIV